MKKTKKISFYEVVVEYEDDNSYLQMEFEDFLDQNLEGDKTLSFDFHHRRYRMPVHKHSVPMQKFESFDDYRRHWEEEEGYWFFPVSMHDHGSCHYFLGESRDWDTGIVGACLVAKSFRPDHAEAETMAKGQVEYYDNLVNGRIYRYSVLNADGDVIASCTGFYDENDAMTDGESEAKAIIAKAFGAFNEVGAQV